MCNTKFYFVLEMVTIIALLIFVFFQQITSFVCACVRVCSCCIVLLFKSQVSHVTVLKLVSHSRILNLLFHHSDISP